MASRVLAVPAHNHEVDDALEIDIVAEIFVVAAGEACADTVMNVHHTRDAVKSVTVELILLHPEAEVREQESKDFVVTIIKEATKQMPSEKTTNKTLCRLYLSQSSCRPFPPSWKYWWSVPSNEFSPSRTFLLACE